MHRRVAMGLLFYPRGGSAQVALYLAGALAKAGWDPELVCGSLGPEGERTNAETFFSGLRVHAASYDGAMEAAREGRDPIAEPFPLHPSYEDRPDAPDRIFTAVSPGLGEHLAGAWEAFVGQAVEDPGAVAVAHLHHLTPLHDAFARALPGVPVVTHLHGTELKMIERAGRLAAIASALGTDARGMAGGHEGDLEVLAPADAELARTARWANWRYTEHWVAAMRGWAEASDRLVVISPHDREEVGRLLRLDPGRATWIPNGVDTERFSPGDLSGAERLERWRRWLVEDPQGWREGGEPGSVAYREEDLAVFEGTDGEPAPVLLFVGRFTEVKRVPLLVRAYARARERFDRPAPLVIWGGFPDEWEGEHPHTVAEREGAQDVFFVGWRGHAELPEGLACSDVMVMPSINESFGQVFVEAMACRLAVIAANAGGPPSFVNTDAAALNGWLVEPDDGASLADAMVEAVNRPDARRERAANGLELARGQFAWTTLAKRTAALYEEAIEAARSEPLSPPAAP